MNFFFWKNLEEHLFLELKGFCISYVYALFDVQQARSQRPEKGGSKNCVNVSRHYKFMIAQREILRKRP